MSSSLTTSRRFPGYNFPHAKALNDCVFPKIRFRIKLLVGITRQAPARSEARRHGCRSAVGLLSAFRTLRECKPDGTPTPMSSSLTTSRRFPGYNFPYAKAVNDCVFPKIRFRIKLLVGITRQAPARSEARRHGCRSAVGLLSAYRTLRVCKPDGTPTSMSPSLTTSRPSSLSTTLY